MAMLEEQWVHMVGIAGAGMSGIAQVLREEGIRVSGSDLNSNSITRKLEKLGVEVYEGHASSNVKEGVDLVVISSAIPPDNSEVLQAREKNIPVIKRGQMLARMVNRRKGIAVAGAHGKTTTTSMIYTVLNDCGLDPTFIVGGEIRGSKLNARLGKGEYFVAEADESDASFLNLNPYIAVVTNIENDHLDYYKSFDKIKNAFEQFLNQVHPDGFALLYGGDACIRETRSRITSKAIIYGEDESYDYYLTNWHAQGMGSSFDVFARREFLGSINLAVPGRHNALNALAAIAVACESGLGFAAIKESLARFEGTGRRFQTLGKANNITIIDDYAHHPTEIKATISAARSFHKGRLVVVFQPHRYSRTQLLGEQIGTSFSDTDLTIITDVYSAGEKPIPGISGELIYEASRRAGCNVLYIPSFEEIEDYVINHWEENDMVITMGAGNINIVGANIARKLMKCIPQA
ncbi:MAG: UDP-N-acetylmuramate--L-alanine ligase [Syntrophomonadaceae bacterium]|jgi:UDP-N-acetylmuramate--alanine ligase